MFPGTDSRSRRWTVAVVAVSATLFLALRWPLLHGDGIIDGTNVDSSIIALMGKKMFEGRGFDIFCWGVRHLGPLTSMVTAAWAWPLSALGVGWVWPLAVRLAAMTEIAAGIAVFAWVIGRIDRRAAAITALILVIGPPELFKLSVYPLGHEMAFLLGAVLLAIATQHVTAPHGRGWLSSAAGRMGFGLVAGIGWWMNRTVVYAIAGTFVLMMLRSDLFARLRCGVRFTDRLLLRRGPHDKPLPGLVEAAAFVLQWGGIARIVAFLFLNLIGSSALPFVFAPILDGLLLIGLAQLIVLVPRFRPAGLRSLRPTPEERREIRSVLEWGAGFAIGDSPALLANALQWYPDAYTVGFGLHVPGSMLREAKIHGPYVVPAMLGVSATPAGIVYAIALVLIVFALLIRCRREVLAYLTLTPSRQWGARTLFTSVLVVTIATALLLRGGLRSRYMVTAFGPLFALVALGSLWLWDSRRLAARAFAGLAFGACLISVATTSVYSRETLFLKPDALLVVQRVRTLDCRVCYLSVYNAYDYRLLTHEQIAWIPYVGHDHSPQDTIAARKIPGRRCFVTPEGAVIALPGDLGPKRKGREIPSRETYLRSSVAR